LPVSILECLSTTLLEISHLPDRTQAVIVGMQSS
jgi:hypothetical protein